MDRAVAAARKAFEEGPWPSMPPNQREALMWKLSNLIEQNAEELCRPLWNGRGDRI